MPLKQHHVEQYPQKLFIHKDLPIFFLKQKIFYILAELYVEICIMEKVFTNVSFL